MRPEFHSPVEDVPHGGDLAGAEALFPLAPRPWVDLSTGINPFPYPVGDIPASAFTRLPGRDEERTLREAAREAYGARDISHVLPAAGTQILLPLIASLAPLGRVTILSPTYAEHARAARLVGHEVVETHDLDELAQGDLAVVVNPNNPDGRVVERGDLLRLAQALRESGGLLLVDEAFTDVGSAESLAGDVWQGNIVVLRSFGKFYGLAGLRLGFALTSEEIVHALHSRLGPWSVSGPALIVGERALRDSEWREGTMQRLRDETVRLDAVLATHGLAVVGGTDLFRLVRMPEAGRLHHHLGQNGILVRRFDWADDLLRIGLPGTRNETARLATALERFRA